MIGWALATHQSRFRDRAFYPAPGIPWDQVVIPNYAAPLGITSLAIIAIGLLVTWAGYIKGLRWTWFVMFVIAWVWAFPVWVLPLLHPWHSRISFTGTLAEALHGSWIARDFVKVVLAFLLMVLALILPAKTFLLRRRGDADAPGHRNPGAEGSSA